jgi:hypothetical protein
MLYQSEFAVLLAWTLAGCNSKSDNPWALIDFDILSSISLNSGLIDLLQRHHLVLS